MPEIFFRRRAGADDTLLTCAASGARLASAPEGDRMTLLRIIVAVAAGIVLTAQAHAGPAKPPPENISAYQALREEVAIAGILDRLGAAERPDIIVFKNVQVV